MAQLSINPSSLDVQFTGEAKFTRVANAISDSSR
jgi:hypothetical protein